MAEIKLDLLNRDIPENQSSVIELFLRAFPWFQKNKVVRYEDTFLTYEDLERKSGLLAQYLHKINLPEQSRVGVCLKPGLDLLVAILGIFRAGMVYVPFDPTHPPAYVKHMIDIANPGVVLVDQHTDGLASLRSLQRLIIGNLDLESSYKSNQVYGYLNPLWIEYNKIDPNLIAVIFFTSGTTGKPKGVPLSHRNIAHFVRSACQTYRFRESDIITSIARYTFSISLFELLCPLLSGGQVWLMEREKILDPENLVRVLENVSVVHAGPSLLSSLFRYLSSRGDQKVFPNIRHASSGGDIVSPSIMEKMKEVFPKAELYVIYGCTEISCMGTTYEIPRDIKVPATLVGKPFSGVDLLLIDMDKREVSAETIGEICFGGPGVTEGYIDQEDLNTNKFIKLKDKKFSDQRLSQGMRYYRTGDLGRIGLNGQLEILGREDFQIQLRGMRVELVGIENTIREKGLAESGVLILDKETGNETLVAYVVGPKYQNVRDFRSELARYFPDYMLPHQMVILDALPLTANGKLDRQALHGISWREKNTDLKHKPIFEPSKLPIEPTNDKIQMKVMQIFSSVLDQPSVELDDDFFQIGGHSLLAVLAIQELQKAFGSKFNPDSFFKAPTARLLAQSLKESVSTVKRPILLKDSQAGESIFFLSGVHLYSALAEQLSDDFKCYGVFSAHEITFPDQASFMSVKAVAQNYLSMIRSRDPKGPYHIVGYSFAGIVAYEMAQILHRLGTPPASLVLIDAILPEWILGLKYRIQQVKRIFRRPISDTIGFVRNTFLSRLLSREQQPLADLRFFGDQSLEKLEARRDAMNHEAAADYLLTEIESYPHPVTLFISGERLRLDPLKSSSCGWRPWIPNLTLEVIDADHYQMIEESPFVEQIAESIKKSI